MSETNMMSAEDEHAMAEAIEQDRSMNEALGAQEGYELALEGYELALEGPELTRLEHPPLLSKPVPRFVEVLIHRLSGIPAHVAETPVLLRRAMVTIRITAIGSGMLERADDYALLLMPRSFIYGGKKL